MFEPPENVNLHSDRATREIAALWARAYTLHHCSHDLDWTHERLRQVSEIPSSRFVISEHRAIAKEIDRCHRDGIVFDRAIPVLPSNCAAGDVMQAMQLKRHDLVIEFKA